MTELLESEGYTILSMAKGKQHGADVVAEREGRKLVVEMKGDSAALDVDLGTGIFQLLRHMQENSAEEYALAVSAGYVKYVRQIETPLRRVGIGVFLVDDTPHRLW